MTHQEEIEKLATALRISLGSTAFLAGADKFFNLLTDWEKYLSPVMEKSLPVTPRTFMRAIGVVEMVVGAGILAGYERPVGYLASMWLLAITANLLTKRDHLDVAVRDANLALEAYTLAKLAELKRWSPALELGEEKLSELDELHRAS
jgi:uncharacterized membrane protein YphA (DoxX/SURF4 family)